MNSAAISFAADHGYGPNLPFSPISHDDSQVYLVATAGPGDSLYTSQRKSLHMPDHTDYVVSPTWSPTKSDQISPLFTSESVYADRFGEASFFGADELAVGSFPVSPLDKVGTWEYYQSASPVSPMSSPGPESSRLWSGYTGSISPPHSSPSSDFLGMFAKPPITPSVTYSNMHVTATPTDIPTSQYMSTHASHVPSQLYPTYSSLADFSPLPNYDGVSPVSQNSMLWSGHNGQPTGPGSSIDGLHIPMSQYKDTDLPGLVRLSHSDSEEKQTTTFRRLGDMIGERTQSIATGISRMWTGRPRSPIRTE